jgi:hypothetical protein
LGRQPGGRSLPPFETTRYRRRRVTFWINWSKTPSVALVFVRTLFVSPSSLIVCTSHRGTSHRGTSHRSWSGPFEILPNRDRRNISIRHQSERTPLKRPDCPVDPPHPPMPRSRFDPGLIPRHRHPARQISPTNNRLQPENRNRAEKSVVPSWPQHPGNIYTPYLERSCVGLLARRLRKIEDEATDVAEVGFVLIMCQRRITAGEFLVTAERDQAPCRGATSQSLSVPNILKDFDLAGGRVEAACDAGVRKAGSVPALRQRRGGVDLPSDQRL